MTDKNPDDSRLTLTIDWPEVTVEKLSRLTSLWANLVQSVTAEATGKRDSVKWIVSSITYASPLQVVASPEVVSKKIDPAVVAEISHAVVNGIAHLETVADMPEYFGPQALSVTRKLAALSDAERHRYLSVSNGADRPAALSSRVVATIDDIVGPVAESLGTIEGRLQGVFTHGKRRLYVYDSLSGRQVRCLVDDLRVPLDSILASFEHRVAISGAIRSKALTGEPLSINAVEFRTFPPDKDLLSTDEILALWGRK